MWFRILALFGTAVVSISCNEIPDGTKCYDCNYDPTLVPEKTEDDFDWAAKSDRGYPRCSLHPSVDVSLVADTLCQGMCFIRKDTNGLVYRGCADPWNLPYHVDTSVNCTRKDDGSIWWFCTGTHCNRGTFGHDDICPGSYDGYQNDVPAVLYAKENGQNTRMKIGNAASNSGLAYGSVLSKEDRNKLDPYVIMESGWDAYRNELEPKKGNRDDSYVEPPATVASGAGYHSGVQGMYVYKPPVSVNIYRMPMLKNPKFAEHYRSLVPSPSLRITNSFGPPEHLKSSVQTGKKSSPNNQNHKSWEGDEYSVSYGQKSAKSADQVKSSYIASKSWYEQQPAKSFQPTKSMIPKSAPSYGKSADSHLYVLAYDPKKRHSRGHTKSISSIHPKSGYVPAPERSYTHQPWIIRQQKSPATYYKTERMLQPSKQYQPAQMSYRQNTYEQAMNAQQSQSNSQQSHAKSSESEASWLEPERVSQQLFQKWRNSQRQSQAFSKNWKASETSSQQFDLNGKNLLQRSSVEWKKSQKKSSQTNMKDQEVYRSNINWYEGPEKSSLLAGNVYGSGVNTYRDNKAPAQVLQSLPVETAKLNFVKAKQLPDYKSANFGDFWYENYYRGDKSGYSDLPVTEVNPCNDDCSGNPSGLYPHPSNSDWFIQCGAGVADSGSYCSCCRPNYLRCPDGTLFDVNTRVCSMIQDSEYGYKPVV
ncbi:hypothetical protein LSH36_261g01040 [Paralvinella palmiformis]|uniref:Chitin-binding type-2 domain-containing protein n=1 Tax=Paralvinella palmiformis TaxID=53620 RepID=A0AAD9N2T6_9ANNE|nr:hypothetical protein LSH36_261g01040 [Paralvinella palmiformis]